MAKQTKLNKLGKLVQDTLKEACSCWENIDFFDTNCTDMYYTFHVSDDRDYIGSNLIEKTAQVLNAFETTGVCRTLYTIEIGMKEERTFPVIRIAVSIK